jgi:hypothetical protein
MVNSLQCVYTSDDDDAYADDFNYICGENEDYCSGIAHNSTTGDYGAYSGCDPKDQLAFVANQYYIGQKKRADACSFSGRASTQSASTASGCASLLSAAGKNGDGTVPTATGKGTAAVSGGSGSGGAASSSKSEGAAPSVNAPGFFAHGDLVMGAYAVLAAGSLLGMLVL